MTHTEAAEKRAAILREEATEYHPYGEWAEYNDALLVGADALEENAKLKVLLARMTEHHLRDICGCDVCTILAPKKEVGDG